MTRLLEVSSEDTYNARKSNAGPRPRRLLCLGFAAVLLTPLATACVIPIDSPTSPGATSGGDAGGSSSGGSSSGGLVAGAPPSGTWTNMTSNLANLPSECGNLSYMTAKPDEDFLIAGIAQKGLWGSHDGGASWQALGSGAGSAMITNRTSTIVFDPKDSTRWWESGLYNGGGVYETSDDGVTLVGLGTIGQNDLVSVDLSDPARKTLLAGGHEQSQTVYQSTDGGMTWNKIGAGLPANTNCTNPLVIDAQTYLVGCGGYGGGPIGVYRTVNSGAVWSNVSMLGGVDAPLVASDGSIYWADSDGGGLIRSVDQGQHWTSVVSSGVINSVHPIELPDGRLATLGTHYILASSDHGSTWAPASAELPYSDAVGLAYSSQQKAFYIWHFTCGASPLPVPSDAIMRFAYDYTNK